MKKILLLITIMIFITGCESKIKYNFDENKIESNVNISFTLEEYKLYANMYFGNGFGDSDDITLKDSISAIDKNGVYAFTNNQDALFNKINYSNNNDNYSARYEYLYTYENIKNNYIMNYCFDSFLFTEGETSYYFKLTGNSKCSKTKFIIKADRRILSNNSIDVKNGEYIWNITEENNDIEFLISKVQLNGSSIRVLNLISILIVIGIGIIGYFLYAKYKKIR